jgi:hypothetical protein
LIAYEYFSVNWAVGIDTISKAEFTADTDTTVLPERIFQLGLRWRFRKSKNLDYAEDFRTYETEVQKLMARDDAPGTIDITGRQLYSQYGNMGPIQGQVITPLATYGTTLPDATTSTDGTIFVNTDTSTAYQLRSGVWVKIPWIAAG